MSSTNSASIKLLNHSVIDQIAAGEVVDRPAHMIKELCENSIDAGATELFVDFKLGGREVIVRDNGQGINPEELPLALARHATSKIAEATDLWGINTYGFRGEALASIGAVSNLKIKSRTNNDDYATQIECDFGKIGQAVETGGEKGTTVEVKDLFANVPARLKFLKSEAGESSAVKNQLKALALANPQIGFRILSNNELIYYWPSVKTHLERAQQVFDREELYWGESTLGDMRAQVALAGPNDTAKNSKQIWLFVRGRHVADRGLQAAVTEGYRNLLMHGEFPVAAVFLDCDPENIDVNVSPTKSQIKFRDQSMAFRAVHAAVRDTLATAPWLAQILTAKNDISSVPIADTMTDNLSFSSGEISRTQYQVKKKWSETPTFEDMARSTRSQATFQQTAPTIEKSNFKTTVNVAVSESSTLAEAKWSKLSLIGQAHLTYIVAQREDAVIFIDQHAAHERVIFEKLKHTNDKDGLEVQNFLLPITVQVPEEAMSELMLTQNQLEKLGILFEQSGPDQIAIQSAPAIVKDHSLPQMFSKMAHEISESGGSFAFEKILSHLLATMACHSAVRAGQSLSSSEMHELLVQMDEHPLSSFCPHGRPVYVEYPIRKLEKDFGRIV